ncbi:hypothetical protein SLEP1_g18094 [Rubroshorea leprosula]|uniref:Uncharacterized protein n=1 Tax=Rubroshorea leprosula TaxID=152421 RepID=A0AAV5J284_9ROSI|nr:hypothetical protein SLEP1_g18094 [Rubroshorea leprosula]
MRSMVPYAEVNMFVYGHLLILFYPSAGVMLWLDDHQRTRSSLYCMLITRYYYLLQIIQVSLYCLQKLEQSSETAEARGTVTTYNIAFPFALALETGFIAL